MTSRQKLFELTAIYYIDELTRNIVGDGLLSPRTLIKQFFELAENYIDEQCWISHSDDPRREATDFVAPFMRMFIDKYLESLAIGL
jgi:hypothetical protein